LTRSPRVGRMAAMCAFRRAGVDVERQGRSCGSADWKFKIPTAWELQFVNEARADDDLRRTMRASRDVRANGRISAIEPKRPVIGFWLACEEASGLWSRATSPREYPFRLGLVERVPPVTRKCKLIRRVFPRPVARTQEQFIV
jgi:hypothetical protein